MSTEPQPLATKAADYFRQADQQNQQQQQYEAFIRQSEFASRLQAESVKADEAERQRRHEREMLADRHGHERTMLLLGRASAPTQPAQLSGSATESRFGAFEWLKHPLVMALAIAAIPFVFSRLFGSHAPVRHVTRRSGPRRPRQYTRKAKQDRFWQKRSRRVKYREIV